MLIFLASIVTLFLKVFQGLIPTQTVLLSNAMANATLILYEITTQYWETNFHKIRQNIFGVCFAAPNWLIHFFK